MPDIRKFYWKNSLQIVSTSNGPILIGRSVRTEQFEQINTNGVELDPSRNPNDGLPGWEKMDFIPLEHGKQQTWRLHGASMPESYKGNLLLVIAGDDGIEEIYHNQPHLHFIMLDYSNLGGGENDPAIFELAADTLDNIKPIHLFDYLRERSILPSAKEKS